jgi:hypothetical protein
VWNAGELLVICPTVEAQPPDVGSMKFGTPCERIHAANLGDAASGRELCAVVDLLEDPQAAIASTHQEIVIVSPVTRTCLQFPGRRVTRA